MVDAEIKSRTKQILLNYSKDPDVLIDYAFKTTLLDANKCRIAVIKKEYYDLIESGKKCNEAKMIVSENWCISEKAVENIIYNEFYKPISFSIP